MNLPTHLHHLVSNLPTIPESVLAYKPSPEKWSRKEILGHLIDSAHYNLWRVQEVILSEEPYVLSNYPQDDLVKLHDYQHVPIRELILNLQSLNTRMIRLVGNASEKDLAKPVILDDQTVTLEWLILDYEKHFIHHVNQILAAFSGEKLPIPDRLTVEKAIASLRAVETPFVELFQFNDLSIEYYQPYLVDYQAPHLRDEIYVVISGSGKIKIEDRVQELKPHDVIFVKAHDEHRFIDFSKDFATWVIFYGIDR